MKVAQGLNASSSTARQEPGFQSDRAATALRSSVSLVSALSCHRTSRGGLI